MEVQVRPKRQVTLPKEICLELGINEGDKLELALENSRLIARPKKAIALEALKEIQEAFKLSGITEEELLAEGEKVRHRLIRERYGRKK